MTQTAKERRFLARDMPPELQVRKVSGSFLFDEKGKKYIDFVMGWCVGNLGWGNANLKKRIREYKGPDYVSPAYSYKPWVELAQLLASIAPGKLTKCFRATGGSEAVDIALQAAMVHTGRQKILSVEDSYHGNTIAALSIGASENRKIYKNLLRYCQKIDLPLNVKTLEKIKAHLKKRDVAAFIMEPISINLGVLVPPRDFMTDLQRLCKKYGTLLIMDEVATGFGRTGRLFASEHFDLKPDILCMGKAITGGVAGMGATIVTPAIGKSMEDKGIFYSTYGWHPVSVAVAIANIRYIKQHQKKLLQNVIEKSNYFRTRLSYLQFKQPAALHIQGLAIGVDVGDEDYASKIQTKCQRKGLLLSIEGSSLLLLPALNIDQPVIEKALNILEDCI
jgi:acetylornithine/succinyldiaminopimelate/putrescine aminotransferase